MKKAFKNIGSLFLALMMLFSTFSFAVEKHFCGGELADYSFVGNLDRCEMPAKTHNDTKETSLNSIFCCQDSIETIEGANDELTVVKELEVQEAQFLVAFSDTYINLFEDLKQHIIPFKDYSSPLVTKDIRVLYNTFLI